MAYYGPPDTAHQTMEQMVLLIRLYSLLLCRPVPPQSDKTFTYATSKYDKLIINLLNLHNLYSHTLHNHMLHQQH